MTRPLPRQPAPALEVETVGGDRWRLADRHPQHFTLIVVYRGLHCPICKNYLRELDRSVEEFAARGVETIALSTDDVERAETTRADWGLERLTLGFGLSIACAREWGLYISTGRGKTSMGVEETAMFAEPGIFLVRADGTLYAATTATMPFARPHFKEILGALDFVIANDYPARGEA